MHNAILLAADDIISGQRKVDYGDAKASFESVAGFWNHYLKYKFNADLSLNGGDVSMLMVLLKISRGITGVIQPDSLVDICGYAALSENFIPEAERPLTLREHVEKHYQEQANDKNDESKGEKA